MNDRKLFSRITAAAIAMTLPALAGTAWAVDPACDKLFTLSSGTVGDWAEPSNWDPSGIPDDTEGACIPSGLTAEAIEVEVEAKSLWVKTGGSGDGHLHLGGNLTNVGTITLYADSRVDGEIHMEYYCHIIVDGVWTMDGTGVIEMHPFSGTIYPGFAKNGTGTHGITFGGEAPLGTCASPGGANDPLLIFGGGEIEVKYTNNAVFRADHSAFPFELASPGNGTGFFIAREGTGGNVGKLEFAAGFSGSGTLCAIGHANAEIEINNAMTGLTGDVFVHGAKMTINQNFKTTGDVEIKADGRAAIITVAAGKTADFN